MDLKEIKNLINEEGKLVIADENGPILVVMSYVDYKKLKSNQNNNQANSQVSSQVHDEIIEQLPIKNERFSEEVRTNSLGIDDLPF